MRNFLEQLWTIFTYAYSQVYFDKCIDLHLETSLSYLPLPPSLCSIVMIANIRDTLHLKNEKMLLFWPLSYNDTETWRLHTAVSPVLSFAAAVQISTTPFPCTFFLHTTLPFPCDFHPLTALSFLVFPPIFYRFPAVVFSAWCLCGHFHMQRRNWTGSYWARGCLLTPSRTSWFK